MKFKGALTAMVTPFLENGEIDEDGLRKNVEFQIKNGIHGLVPVGTTGESATLSYEEHIKVVEIVVDAAKGRVPVIAGTGSNSTREAIMLTREAKEVGADAALLITPYYNKPTQPGLYEHHKRVAEEVDIPQIIYNVPGRTGVNISPEVVAKLADLKNIVGIKEASCNLDQIMNIIELTRGKEFTVLSGEDSWTFTILALGGEGVISVVSNIVPDKVSKLVDSYLSGDIETSRKLHFELLPLCKAMFFETNPGPVKTAMNMMGLPAGKLRLPLVEMLPETKEKLRRVLAQHGLIR